MLALVVLWALATAVEYAVLYGNTEALGYYYLDIWVGSPAILQTVIVDTGSRILAFPCSGCSDCGTHMNNYFDFKNSSTSRFITCSENIHCEKCLENKCWYSQSYSEGSSISGVLIEDLLFVGDDFENSHKIRAVIGCHRKETNLFRTQVADGILGLGKSKNSIPTILDLYYLHKNIEEKVFSLCLAHNGGYLAIGEPLPENDDSEWHVLEDSDFYAINIKGIRVSGKDIFEGTEEFNENYDSFTIIDSGTTFTYLRNGLFTRVFSQIKQFCRKSSHCKAKFVGISSEPNDCYERNPNESLEDFFKSFPVIEFEVGKKNLQWLPENYLFSWPENKDVYCIGIYSNGFSRNVLGGVFMRGLKITFDVTEKKVLFLKSDCDFSFVPRNFTHDTVPPDFYYTHKSGYFSNQALVLFFFVFSILLIFCIVNCYQKKSKIRNFQNKFEDTEI